MSTDDPAASGIRFFVVGNGRSGTTLLRALLDSHPDLSVPPESYFFLPVLRQRARFERADGVVVDPLLAYLGHNPSFRDWGIGIDRVREAWTPAPTDVVTALGSLYGCYARCQGATIVGDKTPHHVRAILEIGEAFPESRFIHLIRDGRDVAVSLQHAPFGPRSFSHAVETWRDNVTVGCEAGEVLGPSRYLEVRYEHLVADTADELERICTFVGCEFDPVMLEYPARADELLRGARHDEHMQGIRRPPGSSDRDWRRDLSPRKREIFETLAGDLAVELGLPIEHRSPRATVRLELAGQRAWWDVLARYKRARRSIGRRVRPRPVERAAAVAAGQAEQSDR